MPHFLCVLCRKKEERHLFLYPLFISKQTLQECNLNFLGVLAHGYMQIQRFQIGVYCVILKKPLQRLICIWIVISAAEFPSG